MNTEKCAFYGQQNQGRQVLKTLVPTFSSIGTLLEPVCNASSWAPPRLVDSETGGEAQKSVVLGHASLGEPLHWEILLLCDVQEGKSL